MDRCERNTYRKLRIDHSFTVEKKQNDGTIRGKLWIHNEIELFKWIRRLFQYN